MSHGAHEQARNKIMDVSGRTAALSNDELHQKTKAIPLKSLSEILDATVVTTQDRDGKVSKTTLGKTRKTK